MKNKLKRKPFCSLSKYEQNILLPILIKSLQSKKGRENAVTNKQIVYGLGSCGLKITDTRVRKLINHIRTNDLIEGLMATSHGYYITNNSHELKCYENTLWGREAAIRKVRMSIIRQRRAMSSQNTGIQTQLF